RCRVESEPRIEIDEESILGLPIDGFLADGAVRAALREILLDHAGGARGAAAETRRGCKPAAVYGGVIQLVPDPENRLLPGDAPRPLVGEIGVADIPSGSDVIDVDRANM